MITHHAGICGHSTLTKHAKFCRPCYIKNMRERNISRKGVNHPRWKGGIFLHKSGYLRYSPSVGSGKFVHIIVLEEKLGRKLQPNEHAHHINENKLDNRPENLEAVDKFLHIQSHKKGQTYWRKRQRNILGQFT